MKRAKPILKVFRLLSFGVGLTLMLSDDLAVSLGLNDPNERLLAVLVFMVFFVLGPGLAEAARAIISPIEAMKRVFGRHPPEE